MGDLVSDLLSEIVSHLPREQLYSASHLSKSYQKIIVGGGRSTPAIEIDKACAAGNLAQLVKYRRSIDFNESITLEVGAFFPNYLINKSLPSINRGFIRACENGQVEMVDWLMEHRIVNDEGLIAACEAKQLRLVEWLIKEREISDNEKFIWAVAKIGDLATLISMIEKIGPSDPFKHIPMCGSGAAQGGHNKLIKWLRHFIKQRHNSECPSLELMFWGGVIKGLIEGGSLEVFQYLLETVPHLLNFNQLLLYACSNGQLRLVKELLNRGAQWTNIDTIFLKTCRSGNLELINWLIELGAYDYENGLMAAIESNNIEVAERMVQKGAKISDQLGSCLMIAIINGYLSSVLWLIKKGVRIWVVLEMANRFGAVDIANYLSILGESR